MSTYKYKVKEADTLQLGESDNPVSVPGALTVAGAVVLSDVLDLSSNLTIGGDIAATGAIESDASIKANTNFIEPYEKLSTTGATVIDPLLTNSLVTTGGTHTASLADGIVDGQIKKIILSVDGGDLTLTPNAFVDGTNLVFDTALDSVTLVWDGTGWNVAQASGVAIT